MTNHVSSQADPMVMARRTGGNSREVGEPFTLDGYTEVAPRLVAGESTGFVIGAGQSNIGNFVDSLYTVVSSRCHMLNPMTGAVYNVKEPVMGCNGGLPGALGNPMGNVTAQVVDKLRQAAWRQRVILCNVAAGSTSSAQWASGDCNNRIRVICKRIKAQGYHTTINSGNGVILWHNGEQDQLLGTTASAVRDNIRAVKATFVSEGITCPMLVCRVAYNSATSVGTPTYTAVRSGQVNAVSSALGIYQGPDTDIYGTAFRYGDLHWNAAGAAAVSTDMRTAIMSLVP